MAGLPSSLRQQVRYTERSVTATVNQLVGDNWSFGARYRFTDSQLREHLAGVTSAASGLQNPFPLDDLVRAGDTHSEAELNEVSLSVLYNHPCGFFARAEANWYGQGNASYASSVAPYNLANYGVVQPQVRTQNLALHGSDFWQFNLLAGYRFYRNQCEVSCGVLNLGGGDYKLNPLNPHEDLPRERTFVAFYRFAF